MLFSSCKVIEKITPSTTTITTTVPTTQGEVTENPEPFTDNSTQKEQPATEPGQFDTNEQIVDFYKKAYVNTLNNGNIFGTDYIEIVPKSFKVNRFHNDLMDSIVDIIFKQLTANNKKIIGLPAQGDELFDAKDVYSATATEEGANVVLDISVINADIIAKEREGSSSFFTFALQQVETAAVENGVSWPPDKSLYDCLDIVCSASGKIVINKEKNIFAKADYDLMVFCKMEHMAYKAILKDTSVEGQVKYEMHFTK